MSKKVYKISGMDCDSCAKMIELDLEDAGFSASCSYAKQSLEVEIKEKSDGDKVEQIVQKSGYKVLKENN